MPVNIVEGCARRTDAEDLNFLNIAADSTAETWYLVLLSNRLGFLSNENKKRLNEQYRILASQLEALQQSLRRLEPKPREPLAP